MEVLSVDCICHLDVLLTIPGLNAIQWTAGAGQPGVGDPVWYDIFRKVRKAGKSLELVGMHPKHVEPLLEAIGPEGVLIGTRVDTEAEARAMLKRVAGWG